MFRPHRAEQLFPNNMKPERGNAIFTLHLERVKARTLSPVALPRNHLNCSLMSTRDKASEKMQGPATDQ